MKLYNVITIPQVDGAARHLLCTNQATAAQWRTDILGDPVMVDAGSPEYIVDHYQGGRLEATVFPRGHVTAEEWAAIHAAIA